jgi:hypothetical protein
MDDIMTAVSTVWNSKFLNFGILNSAYITLLPKKENPLPLSVGSTLSKEDQNFYLSTYQKGTVN